ncbi:MAG: FtsW/RodA/SpoVE family cell cycle protein [Firmicutes bacterium]|nr:FtsW/RodA/SpoVE family cell cycle protein [Bacillota bacterium]
MLTNFFELCAPWVIHVTRWILPALALILVVRCGRSLFCGTREQETWAWFLLPDGQRLPVTHWEVVLGRSSSCDIVLKDPGISRNHAALLRDDKGGWTIYDLHSANGVYVNGERVDGSAPVGPPDLISLGDFELMMDGLTEEEVRAQAESRTRPGKIFSPSGSFAILTLFLILLAVQLCLSPKVVFTPVIPLAFTALILILWLYFLVFRSMRRTGFEIELLAFFLSGLGMSVIVTSAPHEIMKQLFALIIGVCSFIALGWFLRDLARAKKLRWPLAGTGIVLLVATMLFGETIYGAQNWIFIGDLSIQPSEVVKVSFVFAGAATLDRLFARRNLWLFILFSAVCVGSLALMGDFGTGLVFFSAFVIIAFLRSGDLATVALTVAGTGFAGFLALKFLPYIARRFEAWGHVWEFADSTGYQQTRTMSAAASGGFLGVGAGNGWLKNIGAADTDLVFGILAEELGLIIAVLAVASIVILAVFAARSSVTARSSFYVIAACAASTILVMQVILNFFGSMDLLPLTGVTFPFVSNGGSSMVACWGLLAFIKASDTRQNASFAIRLQKFRKRSFFNEEEEGGDVI